jgi:hypothetical protein
LSEAGHPITAVAFSAQSRGANVRNHPLISAMYNWLDNRSGTNCYSEFCAAGLVMLLLASLVLLSSAAQAGLPEMPDIGLAPDLAPVEVTGEMRPGSHV